MIGDAVAPLSLAHLSELEVPPAELVTLAGRAGFASVGLRTMAASPGGIEYPLQSPTEQAALRARMDAAGVSVLYVEMVSLSRTTRPMDCRAMLEAGAAIGATRLAVAGDDPDPAVVADRMAGLCEIAQPLGIAVDLEFMPFRAVRGLADAIDVVRRAAQPNAHILVDALHFFRSGSSLATLAAVDPALIGTFQICDAPSMPPLAKELANEARTRRVLPGAGGLDLRALIAALPEGTPLGVELPIAAAFPQMTAAARLAMMAADTRSFLSASEHA